MLPRTPEHDPGALDSAPVARALFEPLRCGWPDLDLMDPLKPGELTLLDHDGGRALEVLYAYLADAAVLGRQAFVADGANTLDVYRLAQAARRRAMARLGPDAPRRDLAAHEEAVLDRVRVARGFTAHQLQAIVEDGLAREARRAGRDAGLLAAPGLLDMYLDEELSREEARALAGRALASLRRLAGRLRVPVLIVNSALPPASAHPLRILLEESVHEVVHLARAPGGATGVRFPRRGAVFLAPAPGRSRLEDFLPPEERAARVPAATAPRAPGDWPRYGRRFPVGRFKHAWPTAGVA